MDRGLKPEASRYLLMHSQVTCFTLLCLNSLCTEELLRCFSPFIAMISLLSWDDISVFPGFTFIFMFSFPFCLVINELLLNFWSFHFQQSGYSLHIGLYAVEMSFFFGVIYRVIYYSHQPASQNRYTLVPSTSLIEMLQIHSCHSGYKLWNSDCFIWKTIFYSQHWWLG